MAEQLLNGHFPQISELTIVPASGGVFEVYVDDHLIFSKKELGRFPNDREILQLFVKETQ